MNTWIILLQGEYNLKDILSKIGKLVQDPTVAVDVTGFIFALLISVVVGLIVSILYQVFYENRATGSQIHRSFILISPSITALFIAIQFSLPLSLGLLGALSFIRFRTPIKEPEEIGFMMLLIAGSVVCATFQFLLLFVLLGLAVVVLMLQKYMPLLFKGKRKDGILLITLKDGVSAKEKQSILQYLESKLNNVLLQSVSFTENLTTMYYSFAAVENNDLATLHSSLSEIASIQKLNIIYNRDGLLF